MSRGMARDRTATATVYILEASADPLEKEIVVRRISELALRVLNSPAHAPAPIQPHAIHIVAPKSRRNISGMKEEGSRDALLSDPTHTFVGHYDAPVGEGAYGGLLGTTPPD